MAKRQVVKEFLGKIVRAIGRKKWKKSAKKFLQSPEMKKLAKQSAELSKDIDKRLKKDAEAGDTTAQDVLAVLKQMGY